MRERSKDLRVGRSLTAVRKAFNDLVLTRHYNEISITDLTDKAGINRKTFYLHYSSLDDLVSEIEEEMSKEILANIGEYAKNLDLNGCITNFYKYLESCSKVQKKLMCDQHYAFFYNDVTDMVLKSDEFSKFFAATKYPAIVRSYTKAITAIYMDWLNDGKDTDFTVLAETASKLLESGYSGLTDK